MHCAIRCCGALRTSLLMKTLVENRRGAFRRRPRVRIGEQRTRSLWIEDVLRMHVSG